MRQRDSPMLSNAMEHLFFWEPAEGRKSPAGYGPISTNEWATLLPNTIVGSLSMELIDD
jgi:hypothetical protein